MSTGIGKILGTMFVLTAIASSAVAEPGDGISAGNLTLHPGIRLVGGFDSNVFFLSRDEQELRSSPSVKVTPFLEINTDEPDVFNLSLDASVGWLQYLTPDDEIIQSHSGLESDVNLIIGINEKGAFSLTLEDEFERTNEPPDTVSTFAFDRTLNRAGITLGLHPSGRVFQHYLSYDWTVNFHDQLEEIDRHIHDFTLRNYWKFLPRTAFVLTGDLGFVRYDEATRNRGDRTFPNVDSMPLRITGGITGLFTNRLSLKIVGGWGFGFYEQGETFSGFLADLRASYAIGTFSEKSRVYLGYERQFGDATIANFSSWHRPYIGYEQGLSNRRLRLRLRGEVLFRSYEGSFSGLHNVVGGQVDLPIQLDDTLLRIRAGVDFNLTRWLALGLNYNLSSNLTEDRITATGSAQDSLRNYTRHFVGLGLTVKY